MDDARRKDSSPAHPAAVWPLGIRYPFAPVHDALAKGERMARTISDSQLKELKQTHRALGGLIDAVEKGKPQDGPAATPLMQEPQWVGAYRKSWKFLKAVAEAGGRLLPEQLSIIARKNGYDPRGLGGYYTGNGSLRREGRYRVLTEAGERYIRQWEPEFGGS